MKTFPYRILCFDNGDVSGAISRIKCECGDPVYGVLSTVLGGGSGAARAQTTRAHPLAMSVTALASGGNSRVLELDTDLLRYPSRCTCSSLALAHTFFFTRQLF